MSDKGWIGVDLDGTLAHYDGWRGPEHIGAPVPAMVERVKAWLAEGREVRIFTARADGGEVAIAMGNPDGEACRDVGRVIAFIQDWTERHIGVRLAVTNRKDYGMVALWDDRATAVVPNTGEDAVAIERKRCALILENLRAYGQPAEHIDATIKRATAAIRAGEGPRILPKRIGCGQERDLEHG